MDNLVLVNDEEISKSDSRESEADDNNTPPWPSSTSSSSDEDTRKKTKRKQLKEQLNTAQARLNEEIEKIEQLKRRLEEETDAKERVESNLIELQGKYSTQFKELEELHVKVNSKTQYCDQLKEKLQSLGEEIPPEELRNNDSTRTEENKDKLKAYHESNCELQAKLMSNQVLIQTYISQVKQLDEENTELKLKLSKYEDNEASEDTGQLHLQNEELEGKLESTRDDLDDYKKKYNEAISILNEMKEFGEKRDELFESLKEENDSLKAELKNSEEKVEIGDNEGLITTLRQDVLDARLSLERCKQLHREQVAEGNRRIQTVEENLKNSVECLGEHTSEIESLKKQLSEKQDLMRASEDVSNQRMNIINELKFDIVGCKDKIETFENTVSTKENEISELRAQMLEQTEMLTTEHRERKKLKEELEVMESLKEENEDLQEKLDEANDQVKTKKMKINFLKKQLKEFDDQREKFEKIVFVLPEMQKKIDQLEEEKIELREELTNQLQHEKDRVTQLEQERKNKEERVRREKEEWERRLLGIGECDLHHEESDGRSSILGDSGTDLFGSVNSRPNSAPLMKPRPPSARRYKSTHNGHTRAQTNPPYILTSAFLRSSPEGIQTSEKIRNNQQRIIMSGKNHNKLSRSATLKMNHLNSFSYGSVDNFFPKLNTSNNSKNKKRLNCSSDSMTDFNGNSTPRVLVWGGGYQDEDAGKKLVAVGDHVQAKILRDCDRHGRDNTVCTGLVKFIGFINGNEKDVYIGLRMDDEVGNTDGRVEGKRYFRCELTRGKFVHLDDIVKILETNTRHHSPIS